jgi:DNA polymerase III epsilon subunit-like protein
MIDIHTPIIMLDTETTNDIDCPFVYDVGYQIFTLADGVLCERSFVNADIFLDDEMMASAYFADKIPTYWDEIKSGKRVLKKWENIKRQIAKDCKEFGVTIACAHNAAFDNRSLNTTQRWLTKSRYRYFLPYGVEWWDTLRMAREILRNDDNYGEFCYHNDYLTKRGGRRYTAEIIYRWLTDANTFEESHTGLEDVKIEREIFLFCIERNPEIDGRLWRDKV